MSHSLRRSRRGRRRPILAVAFLVVIGVLLAIPIRQAMQDNSAGDDGITDGDAQELAGDYPEKCLDPAGDAVESLVAYVHKDGIAVTEVPGETRVVIDDLVPFKWSPTGTYLAAGSGAVYDTNGEEVDSMFETGTGAAWSWSTIADCAIVADAEGALQVFVPGEGLEPLIDGPTNGFAFSPGGGDLAYVVPGDDSIELWIASLGNGTTARAATLDPGDGDVVLAGWTPDAAYVLFWQGDRDELSDPGKKLRAAAAGEIIPLEKVVAHRDFLDACGKRLIAVIGEGPRTERNKKKLAFLAPGAAPEVITPKGSYDVSPRCSPEDKEIAVVRSDDATGKGPRRLVIIDRFGSPVQEPTGDPNYDDAYPMWGRGGAGVLFVREPADGSKPELWYLEPGETAAPTEAVMARLEGDPQSAREGWGHWIDWTADVPAATSVVTEASR